MGGHDGPEYAEQGADPYIQCVMVIMPPWMLGEYDWGMKRLTDLKEMKNSNGARFYEYTTNAGTFSDISDSERQKMPELVASIYNEIRDSIAQSG